MRPRTMLAVIVGLALCCSNARAVTPAVDPVGLSADVRAIVERVEANPSLGQTPVTIILERVREPRTGDLVRSLQGSVRYSAQDRLEIEIPANRIRQLLAAAHDGVHARLSFPHAATQVVSQGVEIVGAADVQQLGGSGNGIKVGIIDLGFANYTAAQASGDLPAGLTITDYTGAGTGGLDHGTNVAEIVHDMAPGAELYLAKIASDVQMSAAVDDMIAAGVHVINHSVAWFGAAFYDGTGPICDIANRAEAAGILWVNSAGNHRALHYLGNFGDADGDLKHEFKSGQDYNTITLAGGAASHLVLNWDAYPSTTVDYDLILYDGNPESGGQEVAASRNRQSNPPRTRFPQPYESITYTPATTKTYYIVVSKVSASTPNLPITLFSLEYPLGTYTTASSLAQPADCASTLAVAATNLADVVEGFSSQGPTTDGRNKPEISAPNRVVTSRSSAFAGTSAAAPHAAGAVALLRERNPGASLASLRSELNATAHDLDALGFDLRTGYGRLSLDADADGWNHDSDNCPLDANSTQQDFDADSLGDACDPDDDNDGLTDQFEIAIGTNPLSIDTDGDSLTDYDEVAFDGVASVFTPGQDLDPRTADTDGDGFGDAADPMPLVFHFNDGDLAPLGAPNGVVDAGDVLVAQRIVLGRVPAGTVELAHGDLYPPGAPDGKIELQDLILIQQLAR